MRSKREHKNNGIPTKVAVVAVKHQNKYSIANGPFDHCVVHVQSNNEKRILVVCIDS
jgi:hypothetical protein